jgi:hypothetical protein
MRIRMLAAYCNLGLRLQYVRLQYVRLRILTSVIYMLIAPAPGAVIRYWLLFLRLLCGSIDTVRVRIPASYYTYDAFVQCINLDQRL